MRGWAGLPWTFGRVADASWARWRDEFAKACDGSHHSIESIEAQLNQGLWKFLEGADCAFVVEVQDYLEVRACQVWWGAGSLPAIIAALPDLHAWARSQDCTEMLVEGNPAWARVLKAEGYGLWSVTLRRAL